jgi:DNA-binding beta-propeller fold protein YncE
MRRTELKDRETRRRRYRHRRLAAAGMALLVIVAVLLAVTRAVGAWPWADTAAAVSTGGATSTVSAAPATSTVPTTSPLPETTTTTSRGPVGPPVTLVLKTQPGEAGFVITKADGESLKGNTPFEGDIPGGLTTLVLTREGYNTVTRDIELKEDASFTVHLDPAGLLHESYGRFSVGSRPKQVAYTPDGLQIWVTLLGGKGLEVYDAVTLREIGSVNLGSYGSVEVIFNKAGTKAYISQMETGSVYEVNVESREVIRRLNAGGAWTKIMVLSPDEKTLYTANWTSNNVGEIDLASGNITRTFKTVITPRGLYVTPDGSRLYVAGFENGDISRIDLASGDSKVILKTGGAMRHLIGDGAYLYADDMALAKVYKVDLATDEVTELATVDAKPNTIDLSPDGKVLYVSCRGENGANYYLPGPEWGSVVMIDTASGRMLDAIVGGNQCTGLDVSADGTMLAFSDFLDDRVRIYTCPPTQTLLDGDGGRAGAHRADIPKKE